MLDDLESEHVALRLTETATGELTLAKIFTFEIGIGVVHMSQLNFVFVVNYLSISPLEGIDLKKVVLRIRYSLTITIRLTASSSVS